MLAQRLIPLKDRKGRTPAVEIMLNSPLISDLIFKDEVHEIKEVMKRSREQGMQTFDQCAVRPARDRADLLRRRAAQCRLGQRHAAEHQAEQQALRRRGRYPQGYRAHGPDRLKSARKLLRAILRLRVAHRMSHSPLLGAALGALADSLRSAFAPFEA